MKKLIILTGLIIFSTLLSFYFYKNNGENVMLNNSSKADAKEQEKILVAYFSRTGEQYGVGNIQEGNTAIIAKMIAKKTSGDLFEIKPLKDNYPSKYSSLTQFAKEEKMQNLRPELKDKVENFSKYDTIFIGYPNWWGDMPMPVYTFLESYDFKGKKLYHFCTHEGSGGAKEGLSLYGHTAQNDRIEADKKVTQWLKGLGY